MASAHVTDEDLIAYLCERLSRKDAERLLRHLVSGCPECLRYAEEFVAESPLEDGCLARAQAETACEYLASFDRAAARGDELERRLILEKVRADGYWSVLAPHSAEVRLGMVCRDRRFHTWALFDRLLQESREAGFRDPVEAVDLAYLALAVHERLDRASYPGGLAADWRAEALGALGNGKRLAADFEGAAECFVEARQALEEGTGDDGDLATLISLEASLQGDLGCWAEAAAMLDEAIALYRASDDSAMVARTRLQQGTYRAWLDPQEGVRLITEASLLLDFDAEPRLALCAQHNLAWFLNDAGKPHEALETLDLSRPLYRGFPEVWAQVRLRWLEGRISRSLGDLGEAEQTFRRCAEELLRRGLHMEYVLVSIDLADVLAEQKRFVELVALADAVRDLLQAWRVHPQLSALWHVVGQQFRERQIQESFEATLFRDMALYFRRHWHSPEKMPRRQ